MDSHADKIIQLVDKMSIYEQESDVEVLLRQLAAARRPTILSFVNAHAVNLARRNDAFFRNLMETDFALRDGSGVATLFRWLGRSAGVNLNGTDFIPRLAAMFRGRTAALFGTQEPWLSLAADRLRQMGLEVLHVRDGFQQPAAYRAALEIAPVDLVILGMGMPKQETVATELRQHLVAPCLIVNGGAIPDFLAGRFQRAPRLVRSVGMEWGYRLFKEPRRLFKRYVVGNLVFLYAATKLALAQRSEA
jgi:exopolysaccharide biosynthesis WecB/TagA/CpsF family protein